MFTLIRAFYYKEPPSLQEYIFPLLLGLFFGIGIGLWRIQSAAYREQLESTAFELGIANMELKRKNKELSETQHKLRQSEKMEAMGMLAGSVAHDLNNILSGIIIYPELMLREIPENSPLRKQLGQIAKSGEKAAAIIQDLLTLARRRIRHDEIVDIKATAMQYLSSPEYNRLLSFHPNVVVETGFSNKLLPIKGSSIHIYKIIMNLVSNAAEAMPDGGLITISLESRHIDYTIGGYEKTVEGDYTILGVSDTGDGIAPEDIERIFEPFFTKKKMGRSGTGLGMAVVWGTVRDHKGYIEVDSRPGEGSRFMVYLPSSKEAPEPGTDRSPSIEELKGAGELVLIVDDVKEQRELSAGAVQTLGYRTISVPSGEAAIEFLKNSSADIMLLNQTMEPGMNGIETYKNAIRYKPDIKTIIVSGRLKSDFIDELRESGAVSYLQKPFSIRSMGEALKKELH
jgi:signal transduction histidine kinase/CheY-like chemotaxis protein